MRRLILLCAVGLLQACVSRQQRPAEPTPAEQLVDVVTLDSAVNLLDAYLAHAGHVERRAEATVVRRLAGDAIQLSKVAAALQQERADRTKAAEPTAAAPAARSDDSVKEIQRLKDELAAANAELERIRKRLATQKP